MALNNSHTRLEDEVQASSVYENFDSGQRRPVDTKKRGKDSISTLVEAYTAFCDQQIPSPMPHAATGSAKNIVTDDDKKRMLVLASSTIRELKLLEAGRPESRLAVPGSIRASDHHHAHLPGFGTAELQCHTCSAIIEVLIPPRMAIRTGDKVRSWVKHGHVCKACVRAKAMELYASVDPNRHRDFLIKKLLELLRADSTLPDFCKKEENPGGFDFSIPGMWCVRTIAELEDATCRQIMLVETEPAWAAQLEISFGPRQGLQTGWLRNQAEKEPMRHGRRLAERLWSAPSSSPPLPLKPKAPHSRIPGPIPFIPSRLQHGIDMLAINADNINCFKIKAPDNIKHDTRQKNQWAKGMQRIARTFQSTHRAERQQWLTQDGFRDVTDLARLDLDDPHAVTGESAPPRYAGGRMQEKRDEWVRGIKLEAAFLQMDNALGSKVIRIYEELCDRVEIGHIAASPHAAKLFANHSGSRSCSDTEQIAAKEGCATNSASPRFGVAAEHAAETDRQPNFEREIGTDYQTTAPGAVREPLLGNIAEQTSQGAHIAPPHQLQDISDDDDDEVPLFKTDGGEGNMASVETTAQKKFEDTAQGTIETPTALAPELAGLGFASTNDDTTKWRKRDIIALDYGHTENVQKKRKL